MRGKNTIGMAAKLALFSSKLLLLMVFAVLLILPIAAAGSLSFYVRPLSAGKVVSNTAFDYVFNLTTSADCTGVLLSDSQAITTDAYGVGYASVNITGMTGTPSYICEYRGGSLREVHEINSGLFSDIFAVGDVDVAGIISSDTDLQVNGVSACLANGTNCPPFGDDDWNISGNNMFPADLSRNVGIGTDSPSEKLDVMGSGAKILVNDTFAPSSYVLGPELILQRGNTRAGAGLRIQNPEGVDWFAGLGEYVSPDSFSIIYNSTDSRDALLTVHKEGNVGVGTSSPSAKLDVNGGVIVGDGTLPSGIMAQDWEKLLVYEDSGSQWSESYFGAKVPGLGEGAGSEIAFGYGDSSDVWQNAYLVGFWVDNESDLDSRSFWIYDIRGSEMLLYADGDSNVGIGTSSPSQKLHVEGQANITGDYAWVNDSKVCTADNGLCGSGSDSPWTNTSTQIVPGAGYPQDVNISGTLFASNVSSNSPLQLQTGGITRVYVDDATGNVGVGALNPTERLVVGGGIRNNGSITFGKSSGVWDVTTIGNTDGLRVDSDAREVYVVVDNSVVMTADNHGYIGIGTEDPTQRLDINGNVNVSGANSRMWVNGSEVCTADNGLCGGDGNVSGSGMASRLAYWEDAENLSYAEHLTFNGSEGRLQIVGDIAFKNSNSRIKTFSSFGSGGNLIIEPGSASGVGGDVYITGGDGSTDGNVVLAHNGTESKGYVGIGTSSPSAKLDVKGDFDTQVGVFEAADGQTDNIIEVRDNESKILQLVDSKGNVHIGNPSTWQNSWGGNLEGFTTWKYDNETGDSEYVGYVAGVSADGSLNDYNYVELDSFKNPTRRSAFMFIDVEKQGENSYVGALAEVFNDSDINDRAGINIQSDGKAYQEIVGGDYAALYDMLKVTDNNTETRFLVKSDGVVEANGSPVCTQDNGLCGGDGNVSGSGAADYYALWGSNSEITVGKLLDTDDGINVSGNITMPESFYIGSDAQASGDFAMAFGLDANASGTGTIALGYSTFAEGSHNLALGTQSDANGTAGSVALGWNADALATDAISIGSLSVARGSDSISIGSSSYASNTASMAFGDATASGMYSIAIGDGAVANANYAIAIGKDVTNSNANSTRFGHFVYTRGLQSLVDSGNGVSGNSINDVGVAGSSSNSYGVYGSTGSTNPDVAGVKGVVTGNAVVYGVMGESSAETANGSAGVYGFCDESSKIGSRSGYGVMGISAGSTDGSAGVFGNASASSGETFGVHGLVVSPDGYSGYFEGGLGVFVNGSINVSGASGKIYTHELCLGGDCQTGWPSGDSPWTNTSSQIVPRVGYPQDVNISGTLFASNVSSNSPLRLQTSGDTKVYIGDDGNVGIGTDSPVARLDVRPTLHVEGSGSIPMGVDAGMYFNGSNRRIGIGESTPEESIHITAGTSPTIRLSEVDLADRHNWDIENDGTKLSFIQSNSTSLLFPRLVIENEGNVGIGTSSPSAKLDVNGNINVSDASGKIYTPELCLDGDCQISWPSGADDGDWNISGNNMYPADLGRNVGIGTDTPSERLTVSGNASFGDNVYFAAGLYPGNGAIQNVANFGFDGTWLTASSLLLGGTLDMGSQLIQNAGAIQTGTYEEFSIQNSGGNAKYRFNLSSGGLWIGGSQSDGYPANALDVMGDANISGTVYATNYSSNSPLVFLAGGTTRLYIDDIDGNVTIKTGNLKVGETVISNSGFFNPGECDGGSMVEGDICYSTSLHEPCFYNGTAVITISSHTVCGIPGP
ncbi:hypothetical protein JW968_04975 [Candidatus Woesearchaeota archaeon]|nr:hypothetical protein [Candidatus Woesearchaeota archaeon]